MQIQKLYIVPTFNCNLNCPHCDIHLHKSEFSELFYEILQKIEFQEGILFGGEPTLYKDRLIKCLETKQIHSISTNLINLDDELISLYKKYKLGIATSWNPKRFNGDQYNIWVDNLRLLQKHNLSCTILITLTEDLLKYDNFMGFLCELDDIKSIDGILFEPLVDYNMKCDLHERVDEWLCDLHDNWRYSFPNLIEERLKNWNCDCSDVWTLMPDGKILNGCPQFTKMHILSECLTCEMAGACKPCVLQHMCSFPKKLYNKIKG